jgi:hypothetical protein
MKPIARDISVTLIIKLALLFALWSLCFKGTHKPIRNFSDWMLGDKRPSLEQQVFPN